MHYRQWIMSCYVTVFSVSTLNHIHHNNSYRDNAFTALCIRKAALHELYIQHAMTEHAYSYQNIFNHYGKAKQNNTNNITFNGGYLYCVYSSKAFKVIEGIMEVLCINIWL